MGAGAKEAAEDSPSSVPAGVPVVWHLEACME